MRVAIGLSITVCMLSACSPAVDTDPDAINAWQSGQEVVSAAKRADPATAADKSPARLSTGQGLSGNTMPIPIRGRWRKDDLGRTPTSDDCNPTSQSNRNFGKVMTVSAGGYSLFEDGGRIIKVHGRTDTMIDATFDTAYADLTTASRKDFALQPNGSLAVNHDDGGGRLDVTVYLRCP